METEHPYAATRRLNRFNNGTRWNLSNTHNPIKIHGETVVDLSLLPDSTVERLVKNIKRGYGSSDNSSFYSIYEFVCIMNPIYKLETGLLYYNRFRFPLFGGDCTEFLHIVEPFAVVNSAHDYRTSRFEVREKKIGDWHVAIGMSTRDKLPPSICKLVKPFLNKYRKERLDVCRWLTSGECEPIHIPFSSMPPQTKHYPELRELNA